VAARPIATTTELAEIVRDAIPAAARRTGGHPAKRTFQAIRIEVNRELEVLPDALEQAIDRLAAGGRCAVLTYHSGEDRIVKDVFRHATGDDEVVPPGLPVEPRPAAVRFISRRAQRPGADEVARNRRAESARLRAVERVTAGAAS
jgi:16S rRNA (cytosine1402-N4)-methyltransferase